MADEQGNPLTQEGGVQTEAAETPAETATEAGSEAPAPVEKPARDFKQERIDRLVREREEARREAEEARKEAAAAKALAAAGKAPETPEVEKPLTRADVDRLAEEKVAAQSFAKGTQRIADEGRKAFPDFQTAIDTISQNFGDRIPRDFYEAIIDLDNGHEVFREIALDPDLTDRILALSPTRRAVEIGKLANKPKGPGPQVSRAPAPITPIRGSAAGERSLYDDKISSAEWIAKREAELAAKRVGR